MVSVLVLKAVDCGFIGAGYNASLKSGRSATDEPMIYRFRDKHANHYATDEPTIYRFRDKYTNHYATWVHQGGLAFFSKTVDRGFIGGVMVSILVSKAVYRGFISGVPTIYRFRDKYTNHYANDEPTIYRF
jgi:hypothetical protein